MLLRFALALTFLGGSVLALVFTGCDRQAISGKSMNKGPIVYVALASGVFSSDGFHPSDQGVRVVGDADVAHGRARDW